MMQQNFYYKCAIHNCHRCDLDNDDGKILYYDLTGKSNGTYCCYWWMFDAYDFLVFICGAAPTQPITNDRNAILIQCLNQHLY